MFWRRWKFRLDQRWAVGNCSPSQVLEGHQSWVSAVKCVSDTVVLSGGSDGNVVLWCVPRRNLLRLRLEKIN